MLESEIVSGVGTFPPSVYGFRWHVMSCKPRSNHAKLVLRVRDKGLALESMSGEDPGLPQIKFHVETRRCGDRVAHPHRERSLGRYKFIPVEPD